MNSDAQTVSYNYKDNTRGIRACYSKSETHKQEGANCARGKYIEGKKTYRKPMAVPRTGPKLRDRIGTQANSNNGVRQEVRRRTKENSSVRGRDGDVP